MPLLLYNVPSRTACDLLPETVERLAGHPQIIGIKEATGSLERGAEILARCGDDFLLLSGDDATCRELIGAGAQGVITVTGNVAPRLMHEMIEAALAGDQDGARELDERLAGLHTALFVESNPIPVKWALGRLGLIGTGIRLPLVGLCGRASGNRDRGHAPRRSERIMIGTDSKWALDCGGLPATAGAACCRTPTGAARSPCRTSRPRTVRRCACPPGRTCRTRAMP